MTFVDIGGVEKRGGPVAAKREVFEYPSCPIARKCGAGGCRVDPGIVDT